LALSRPWTSRPQHQKRTLSGIAIAARLDAAAKAGASLMAGASGNETVRQYRKRVLANAKRLGKARTRRHRK
jgi:hypothetical protein